MTNCPIFNLLEFPEYAELIAKEIHQARLVDPDWHHAYGWKVKDDGSFSAEKTADPNDKSRGVFDDVRLHFVNRNFNILYLESTIHLALTQNYEWNPMFVKSRELFDYARKFNNETGPFGRMIVWSVPPNSKIDAHTDELPYQTGVTRYIFTASNQSSPNISIRIKDYEVSLKPGTMFGFNAEDLHEFINNSNDYWYFLGIDYWIPNKLKDLAEQYTITKDSVIQYDEGYGLKLPKSKYWTRH